MHYQPWVRDLGIAATDAYVEICWGQVAPPRAARLVSVTAKLTKPDGYERLIAADTLWEALGETPAPSEVTDDGLVRAAVDADYHGLGRWYRNGPDRRSFTIYEHVQPVGWHRLHLLDDAPLAHHVATVHNLNQRVGRDNFGITLPDWVYFRAGLQDTSADLGAVWQGLTDRSPDIPELRFEDAGSARQPPSRHPAADTSSVEPTVGQQFYSTATGDRFEYLGDDAWRIVGGPSGVPSTVPVGGIVETDGVPDHWRPVSSEPAAEVGMEPGSVAKAARRRLDSLTRGEASEPPGVGL